MPSARTGSTPPGPNSKSSTAFVSETHIHTTSAPSAASAGEAVLRAPSTSLPAERFQTATSCPALTRLAAIDRPIIPMPRKATRISFDSSRKDSCQDIASAIPQGNRNQGAFLGSSVEKHNYQGGLS